MRCVVALLAGALAAIASPALALCAPDALGTARVLEVPAAHGAVGDISYRRSLPLAPGEVVLTFDDGPMPRRTPAVLAALRAECARATFFVVGVMAASHPALLRRIAAEGHTIASHSWSHAYLNRSRSAERQREQIDGGFLAAGAALGPDHSALSPFFRFPGLGRTPALDRFVAERNLVAMSADIVGDDWRRIGPAAVLDRTMARLRARGRGIILLHDIQHRTVEMLPALLRTLKAEGYRLVHIVPAAGDTRLALARTEQPANSRIAAALARLDGDGRLMAAMRGSPAGTTAVAAAEGPMLFASLGLRR